MSSVLSYRSYNDLIATIRRSSGMIRGNFDLVVGVPRSGMIPAYLIGLHLHLPVMDLETFVAGGAPTGGARSQEFSKDEVRRILVVDDSVQFGTQMGKVRARLKGSGKFAFKFLAVYAAPESTSMVDIFLELVPAPRVFEWNIMHSWIYTYSCVDIDGVLCFDPTDEENDDGERYRHFVLNARPKFIPPVKVHTLVTARLEKYRKETETWLGKHGVQYQNLVMLDLPNKETRVRMGSHGKFKSSVYSSIKDAVLFIESDINQARVINAVSNRPVFCADTMEYLVPMQKKRTFVARGIRKVKSMVTYFKPKVSLW